MTEEDLQGYRGTALELLKSANVKIGDRINVQIDETAYEGTLMPRTELGDPNHIVVKLSSGYNIGVAVTSSTRIRFLNPAEKPAFVKPETPPARNNLPSVAVVSTGGTIASRVDYRTGAVHPALSAEDFYSVAPELSSVARIKAEVLFSLLSENIEPNHWTVMAETVARHVREGAEGVVVTHGTDTMGFTAAALSFALRDLPVPVILVGSQRSSDRPSSDATLNLMSAVAAAAHAPFAEVTVAMHESTSDDAIVLHRGAKVRKCHTSSRDAFKSVNAQPIARVRDLKVSMLTHNYKPRNPQGTLTVNAKFNEKAALIQSHPGLSPTLIDWLVDRGYMGIILEGTGLGHVSRSLHDALTRATRRGVVVGMTSQCLWGRVRMTVYDTGRDLLDIGVLPLDDMLPETALVKLMWTLGQTANIEEAKQLMLSNLAGEFSEKTSHTP